MMIGLLGNVTAFISNKKQILIKVCAIVKIVIVKDFNKINHSLTDFLNDYPLNDALCLYFINC